MYKANLKVRTHYNKHHSDDGIQSGVEYEGDVP
jgi:hypothetical protein